MTAFYNEIEPFAAAWLKNLCDARHIANGTVDSRSIADVQPADLKGLTQAHFFAGVGVWSYALRLAGWSDDAPVWTGSCPCQPFSGAGKRGGFADERHLWPEWFRLIKECRPPVVFGEQVASPDGLRWLDAVSADLEGGGYAFGAAVLPAAGVGAPHIRHRIYFVAYADPTGRGEQRLGGVLDGERPALRDDVDGRGSDGGVADPNGRAGGQGRQESRGSNPGGDAESRPGPSCGGGLGGVGDAYDAGPQGRGLGRDGADERPSRASSLAGFWSAADWIPCRDGKLRPVEPGTFPLAHGATSRVGRLRAYGNAIVAEVAATFIRAAMTARHQAEGA